MLNRLLLLLAWLAFVNLEAEAVTVTNLTCNGRVNPLGIGTNDISFSWAGVAGARGVVQSGYQIRVGTTAGGAEVWDSDMVSSNRQTDITLPPGISLLPARRYYWQVRVKDGNAVTSDWSQTAWFETGLLTGADWAGAEWITRVVQPPDPTQWSNYTVTVEFTLDSEALGVFLRSSEDGQNAYMFQINVTGATPIFKPHERNNGTYTVLPTVDLAPFGYSNASLTGTTNTLQFVASGTTITTFLNGTQIHSRTDSTFRCGLVGFRTFGAEAASVHRVQVVRAGGGTLIDPDFSAGENGFSNGNLVNGSLHIAGTTDAVYGNYPSSLPLLRGKFVATNTIVSARVYASAQGLYEVSLNGQKAGDQFLAPGWTDYNQRILSQTYDVTSLVQPGTNVIGVKLADGWYRGKVGIGWKQVYGSQIAAIAKIKVTYANGVSQWFGTDAGWKFSDGPYISADLQDGETYNAGLAKSGWDTAPFNDSQWTTVGTVANVSSRLVPQPDEPIRVITVLTATNRTQPVAGKWLYDLGQNMVGVARIQLTGTNGQIVTIRHGEELYRVGAQTGQLYTDNLRSAKATDTYAFATNGSVTYQPKFTQHGFRYIEISGVITPPAVTDVQGVVIGSNLPGEGDLHTSSPLLNKLVSNIRWGQRGNFVSIPTDTPARDERLGWTGDINVFSPAAARYLDTRAFLSKWMTDVRDAQFGDGNIPAVVPRANGTFDASGVGWEDAMITVPYSVWRATGDRQILRANWTAMKAFYGFVSNSATADGDLLEQGRSSWFSGDWLSLEQNWNRLDEHKVIATAYFAEDTRMMSEMAAAMGETGLASQLTALVPQIRAAFVAAYRNPDGSIFQGTQCAYALALGMDMIADSAQRAQTADKFVSKLAADNNHLKTGFLGTPWLLPALSKIGRDDLAMRLLQNEDYPSWGFPISIGATTMWERWNSIQPDLTFGPVDMNSFNHYAYGAVGDWMFGNLGGIQALMAGYQQSRIAPLAGFGGLTNASCFQQTPFGRLATAWNISNGVCVLSVEIPVNAGATVNVPTKSGATVYEGAIPAGTAPGVQYLGTTNGVAAYAVGSGTYVFTSTLALSGPTNVGAISGMNQVRLTWAPSPFATSYDIRRATVAGGPYTTVAGNVVATNYTDATAVNGVTYYYVVSARNAVGEGADSSEVSATPQYAFNSGFEAPAFSTFQYSPSGGMWMFSAQSGNNGSGITANGSLFNSSNPNAPEGAQVAFLQGFSTIAQIISGFVPGANYTVTFSAAQRAGQFQQSRQTWDLRLDGAVIASYGPAATATSFADYTAGFTATAAAHTLSFVGTDLPGGDNTVFLDNVRIVPAPSVT
ncbi:MAG TPA: family 78 glycoside hydrolase catalytic domain, partial [Candidatus Paceibacterota bacterium]|nr:family 78 glycoside hydrolase catalytic domain [Candidatus Paceibacterota bacterium]